jgi:hypothetical protein
MGIAFLLYTYGIIEGYQEWIELENKLDIVQETEEQQFR